MAQSISHQQLVRLIDYDVDTGEFRWRRSGKIAGSTDDDGYVRIKIDGRRYAAGRLGIFWVTGKWPRHDADHRDGKPSNNIYKNLRDATVSQNLQNKKVQSNNKLGLKGVYRHKQRGQLTGKFRSQIKVGGRVRHLGLFDCPAAAHLAYVVKADQSFGEFARSS